MQTRNIIQKWFQTGLRELEDKHLTRILSPLKKSPQGFLDQKNKVLLDFASNDYLNLAGDERIRHAASEAAKVGGGSASASRLVTGTRESHIRLEDKLAKWTKREEALIFGTGYQTNIGVVQTLVGRNDTIFIDKFAHASLVDGSILSRAKIKRFKHNDLEHLETRLVAEGKNRKDSEKFLIITESIFSMDGDSPNFSKLSSLAAKFDCLLLVDEAHSFGVAGENGSGFMTEIKENRDLTLVTGTFSKSLASFGGFVCCSSLLKRYLTSKARSFIFSTAPPPACLAAAESALEICKEEKILGSNLLKLSGDFRELLQSAGFETMTSTSQIIPVLIGTSEKAVIASTKMKELGVMVAAMRTPTVPEGQARLRFSVNLKHDKTALNLAKSELEKVLS